MYIDYWRAKVRQSCRVTAHELAHTWFQFYWQPMKDFTNGWMKALLRISARAENVVMDEQNPNPFSGSYRNYRYLATSGRSNRKPLMQTVIKQIQPMEFRPIAKALFLWHNWGISLGRKTWIKP